jgi:hypothetical protein
MAVMAVFLHLHLLHLLEEGGVVVHHPHLHPPAWVDQAQAQAQAQA